MAHSTRHGGTWRETVQPSIRHGGAWRAATAAWIRKAGAWEQWWPGLPDRGGPYLFGTISSVGPNICRYDGSLWVSVGGGVASAIGAAALNDAGQIFASIPGTTSKYWDGSSWATISPSFYQTNMQGGVASDGTTFTIGRVTPGFDPVKIFQFTPPSTASDILSLQDTSPSSSAIINTQCIGQYGGYVRGSFNSPASSPLYFSGGGTGAASMLSSLFMARQLDGNVWTGPSSGGAIAREDGALDTWLQIGGTVSGGDVTAICALPDGRAWAGGSFTSIDGVSIAGLAEWDGSAWQQVASGLSDVVGMSFHRGLLWILAGATATNRTVYTWDGSSLTSHSNWSGDTVLGIL